MAIIPWNNTRMPSQYVLLVACLLLSKVFAASPTSKNPFTNELTGVSGFGARSQRKTIFPYYAAANVTESSTASSSLLKDRPLVPEFNSSILLPEAPTQLWAKKSKKSDALWIQIQSNEVDSPTKKTTLCLTVDKNSGDWRVVEETVDQLDDETLNEESEWIPIEGLYGMYRVPSGIIWILISKTETVYTAPKMENNDSWWKIRRVVNLELVHLSRPEFLLTTSHLKEEIRQLRLLRQALKYHDFYFVPNESTIVKDMTKNLQESLLNSNFPSEQRRWWETSDRRPDPRFFWNQAAVVPLLQSFNVSEPDSKEKNATTALLEHVLPLTSAFVGVQSNLTTQDGTSMGYDQVLISRRSKYRAGTRFTRRGADASGSVANFVETEQVSLIFNNTSNILCQAMSHVQTRGSIPLRWSSPADVKTYRPRIRIGTDPLAQARALRLHLLEQHAYYGKSDSTKPLSSDKPEIVFVNLIDKHSDQGRLGRAFDAVLTAVMEIHSDFNEEITVEGSNNASTASTNKITPSVEHIWYDFHAEVKGGRWHKLGSLLKDLQPVLSEHGFFHADASSPDKNGLFTIKRRQYGAVRTNCMDCLDRTNVVQSMLGRFILFEQISTATNELVEEKAAREKWESYASSFQNNQLTLPWSDGEVAHRLLWADNADAISRLYAGTPALKGDFTRTGKRTKRGALDDGMNSLQRYYLNNFLDADRQEGMDLLVGYANFSNAEFLEDDEADEETEDTSSSATEIDDLKALFSIQEATRQNFLGDLLDKLKDKDQGDVKERLSEIGVRGGTKIGARRSLDLRWLPGDLQCHVISQAVADEHEPLEEEDEETKTEKVFRASKKLEAIDLRSASPFPWWADCDDSAGSDDGEEEKEKKEATESAVAVVDGASSESSATVRNGAVLLTQHQQEHQPLTPIQLLGIVLIALNSPMGLATLVAVLLIVTFLPGFFL